MNTTSLVTIYDAFQTSQGLKLGSADEHTNDRALTESQRLWLRAFCGLWEATEDLGNVTAREACEKFWTDAGFEKWDTGGGCTAFGKKRSETDESHVLVTTCEDASAPASLDEQVDVGFYDADGQWLGDSEPSDWPSFTGSQVDALAKAREFLKVQS